LRIFFFLAALTNFVILILRGCFQIQAAFFYLRRAHLSCMCADPSSCIRSDAAEASIAITIKRFLHAAAIDKSLFAAPIPNIRPGIAFRRCSPLSLSPDK
jgi:hypothetical protein